MVFKKRFVRRSRAVKSVRSRSKGSSGLGVMDVLLAGAIYGAVRKPIADMLPTFFSFGPVDSDNVILAGAGYLASRQSNKLIKSIGLIAMGTEAGIVASNAVTSGFNFSSNSTAVDNYTPYA